MAHPGFGHLWKQPDMADLDIVFLANFEDAAPTGSSADKDKQQQTVLQRIAGHSQIISLSPYFVAQVQRWVQEDNASGTGTGGDADDSCQQAKRQHRTKQVHITLPDASYEPAALAVLAGLYLVKPWPQLLADLTPQQQVQAAVLADMWQLPDATKAAVTVLRSAIAGAGAAAVLEQLLAMAAVPDCLQALLEQALLRRFGDLEAVWRDTDGDLQASLLALPVPAMELLLASDKLKVSSEDTVLFTAREYARVAREAAERQQLEQQQQQPATGAYTDILCERLGPLVRWPHLSHFWLAAAVLATHAPLLLQGQLRPQVRQLLSLTLARQTATTPSVEEIQKNVTNAPASWLLPVRDIQPISSVEVEWEVDIAAIRQAAQDCARSHSFTSLASPSGRVLAGVKWRMALQCEWDAEQSGSTVGIFAVPELLPPGALCCCTYSIECVDLEEPYAATRECVHSCGKGWADFFEVGTMAGGFDEGAWAAAGLPTSGSIVLKLTVRDVGQ